MADDDVTGANRPPNILFFFPDQHRPDWLGANPEVPVRTPNLDTLAGRGVRFTRAYCPSPLCAPSRACLASGKEYDRCGVPSNQENFQPEQTSFYRLLRDAGYDVGGCGKFDLHKGEHKWGPDGRHRFDEWGFTSGVDNAGKWDAINSSKNGPAEPYTRYLAEKGLFETHVADFENRRSFPGAHYAVTSPTPLPEEAYCDNWIGNTGLELLRGFASDRPWFLQINFTGPHEPVDITARMERACRGIAHPAPHGDGRFPPETHQLIRQNYSAMVENIDRWVGALIEAVETRGERENTLIVYSSDHGEMLGDHGLWGKSVPWEASSGVPLIMAGPGIRNGAVSDALVNTLDLAATYLEAADLAVPDDMDSRSLRLLLEGKTDTHRDHVFVGLKQWRAACDGHYKLVTGYPEAGDVALYDIQTDPWEDTNIADSAPFEMKRLTSLLKQEQARSKS